MNLTIEEYVNKYKWYQSNNAFILNASFDIGNEHTQDMFVSNMTRVDEVRIIIAQEQNHLINTSLIDTSNNTSSTQS